MWGGRGGWKDKGGQRKRDEKREGKKEIVMGMETRKTGKRGSVVHSSWMREMAGKKGKSASLSNPLVMLVSITFKY